MSISEDDMDRLERVAVGKGIDGDVKAIDVCRRFNQDRGRRMVIDLPRTDDVDGVKGAHAEVLAAMAAGTLTTREARDLSTILEHRLRMLVAVDLKRRLKALEAAHQDPTPPDEGQQP